MVIIYLLLTLAAIIYYYLKKLRKRVNYWKDRGVAQLDPDLLYGDTKEHAKQEKSSAVLYREFYYKFKNMGVKYGGVYETLGRPVFVPVDPSIIKLIVTKDFNHFTAHHPKFGNNLLFNNLFHQDGEEWKEMRRKLTPTFTSGKMKMMFEIMHEKTVGLTNLMSEIAKSGKMSDMKELLARYTTDVIGSCGFGIECDSITDENSVFFQRGQDIFRKLVPRRKPTTLTLLLLITGMVKRKMFDLDEVENFFRSVVNDTVKYREENKVVRKDFLHLMIQLKNKGSITDILNEKDVYQGAGEEGLSMEDIAGQCMLFFTAGFETSSTTMSFALLELAQNQNVQSKLREEVRTVLEKYNGVLSYDSLQEMTYCENVIKETLRKYPPVFNLPRVCTKDYQIPDSDTVIAKGTILNITSYAIQNDPEYFPEPEKFDPERFSAENKDQIIFGTYLPFGEGPRMCLGLRFGMMQSKAGIASLINRFNFTLNKRTPYPPKICPISPILSVQGGIYLDLTEVK